jgi:hypothetical protein
VEERIKFDSIFAMASQFNHLQFNFESMETQEGWFFILVLAACIFLAIAVCIHHALLPKPIPGIPYNKASANRILGDAPDVSQYYQCETKFSKLITNRFLNGTQIQKKSGAISESLLPSLIHR